MLTTVLAIYTEYRNITFSTPFWGFGPTDGYSDSLHGSIHSVQPKDKGVSYSRPRSFCLLSDTTGLLRHTTSYLMPHKMCRRRVIKTTVFVRNLHFENSHGVILLQKVP